MKSLALALATTLFLLVSTSVHGAGDAKGTEDPRIQRARELFDLYVRLEHAFDTKAADLYADEAVIRNKRTYPTGQVRELTLPAPQYKDLLRQSMPTAKSKGDVNTYSDVTYAIEGEGVRIRADRFSELKKYHSPISILVKPTPSGAWLIHEELSESRPF